MTKLGLLASAIASAACLAATAAQAQNTINIGLSGSLTGPSAGSYAPAIEGLRLYVERINKAGGIGGRQVNLILQDDQGQASRGAANAKKLLTQDNVALLINASLSATYAPMIQESQRAGVPLLFAGAVCPKEVYPPAQDLLFCTTAFAAQYDSRAILEWVKGKAGTPKIGLVAMAIPVSRGEIDFAEGLAKEMGMQPVGKEVVPPPTPDYTPFATNLSGAGAEWVYAWAPWVTQVKTLEALRRLGWKGDYVAWGHLETEGELARLKDDRFYAVGANSLFNEKLPVHEEITQAAKAANSSYAADQMAEGWVAGLVLEAALKASGGAPDKLKEAMTSLKVDTKGLRGGPIEWTKDNHFRTRQYYRVYRWNPERSGIEVVKDWAAYDVK